VDEPVVPGGPVGYFSTLPVKACLQALTRAGIPAEVSQTAGTYVCNHVFYALMHQLAERPGIRGGFIHVPYAPEQLSGRQHPSMEIAVMAQGLEVIARTALSTGADIKLGAGATH
jgi:pyroglutamyl-peptidase